MKQSHQVKILGLASRTWGKSGLEGIRDGTFGAEFVFSDLQPISKHGFPRRPLGHCLDVSSSTLTFEQDEAFRGWLSPGAAAKVPNHPDT